MINQAESWDAQKKGPQALEGLNSLQSGCVQELAGSLGQEWQPPPAFDSIGHWICFKPFRYISLFFFSFYRRGN